MTKDDEENGDKLSSSSRRGRRRLQGQSTNATNTNDSSLVTPTVQPQPPLERMSLAASEPPKASASASAAETSDYSSSSESKNEQERQQSKEHRAPFCGILQIHEHVASDALLGVAAAATTSTERLENGDDDVNGRIQNFPLQSQLDGLVSHTRDDDDTGLSALRSRGQGARYEESPQNKGADHRTADFPPSLRNQLLNGSSGRPIHTMPSFRRKSENSDHGLDESTQTVRRGNNTGGATPLQRPSHQQQSQPMRGSMRSLLLEPSANLSDEYLEGPVSWKQPGTVLRKGRLLCGLIVENPKVQVAIIGLILINAIMMGVSTFGFVADHERTDAAFTIADTVLLSLFTLELALQLCYRGLQLFLDSWLVFDFVIIVASWSLTSTQVIRAFRIFRAVRLVTRIGPLRELITAIGAVMPRMYAITMLLLLIFYVYSVLFTELFGELELSQPYFKSLTHSLFTCMELMTMQWSAITREVMEQKHWAWAPFLTFIALTGFIVYNLIVAVVCDAVAVIDRNIKAEQQQQERDGTAAAASEEDSDVKLLEAQERIYELTRQVATMSVQHSELCRAMGAMSAELQQALAALDKLQATTTTSRRLEQSDHEGSSGPSVPTADSILVGRYGYGPQEWN